MTIDLLNVPGIYCITNLITGQRMIGQTHRLRHRVSEHFSQARNGRHGNKHFQFSFDKYGEGSFSYQVLCESKIDDLTKNEQSWMDHFEYLGVDLYNKIPAAANANRVEKQIRHCPECNAEMLLSKRETTVRRFCCRVCAATYWANHRKPRGSKYKTDEEKREAGRQAQSRYRQRRLAA